MANFSDYIAVLKSGVIRPRIKIEWLRPDETVESILTSDILGGNLTINRSNGVRRAIDFTVKNSPELLPNIYGIWINKKIKLSLGVICSDGEDFFIPQGVFVIANPTYISSPSGSEVTFTAIDKYSSLLGESGSGILKDIYQINNGTLVNDGIKALLLAFNDNISPNLYPNSITFPYTIRKGQEETIGSMLQDICMFTSYNGYYDTNGVFTTRPDVDDINKGVSWEFGSDGDSFTYLGSSVEYRFNDIRNMVICIGANINGTIVKGIAKDEDLTSPTNVFVMGEIPFVMQSDYLQTDQQALDLAKFMLKRKKVVNQFVNITSIPVYHLDVDEIVTVTDSNLGFDRSRLLATSINMSLEFGGQMTTTCVLADEIDFTIASFG